MNPEELEALMERKSKMRRQAYDARNAQENKEAVSKIIIDTFVEQPEYKAAKTVMWYIDARSEVRTRPQLEAAIACKDKKIAVPYCVDDVLQLWWLESMDEMVVGMWKILEPPKDRWNEAAKRVDPGELDLVMVPGVGFDRRGARMGNGKGYYDKLLEHTRADCTLLAPAYACQMFPEIIVGPHDMFMDKVITEKAVYPGLGRKGPN
ncbi:MAG: 5-formyltetrahydrofolate cyclo-ligase [Burkholderiales bacterium]